MSSRLFLILVLAFSLLQGSILPGVFLEGLMVILLVFSKGLRRSLPFLFLGGILFDLFQLQPLGVSSLIFILLGSLAWILREHITPEKGLFLAACVVFITIARSYFVYNTYSFSLIILSVIISLLVFNVLQPIVSTRKGFDI